MGNIDWQPIGAMLFCLVVAAIVVSSLFCDRNQDGDLTGRLDRLNTSIKKNIATLQEIEVGMQSTYAAVAQILIGQACRRNTYEDMVIHYIESHQGCPLYGLARPGEMYEKVFDAWVGSHRYRG